jgi:hypothetical protein
LTKSGLGYCLGDFVSQTRLVTLVCLLQIRKNTENGRFCPLSRSLLHMYIDAFLLALGLLKAGP